MVQFRILSGKKAGTTWRARRFPVRVGRSGRSHLQLEEPGVFERHLRLEFERGRGVLLHAEGEALATVNGEPVREAVLKNGDSIEIGSARVQFWLSDTEQTGLRFREWLTWIGIAVMCLGQVALIYYLIQGMD